MPSDMVHNRDAVREIFNRMGSAAEERIEQGIEANRKGPMKLVFRDAGGKVLENVHVKLTQRTHDFKYGANLFMLDEIIDSKEKNETYKELFKDAFNLATLPFYWNTLEPEEGKARYTKDSPRIYRRPTPDLCLEWCEANGIEPKAHCLNYASMTPPWAKGDVAREWALLEKRFAELSERYASRIPMWEVTNETYWGIKHEKLNAYQQPDFIEKSFKLAEKYFPKNELVINEEQGWVWADRAFHRTRSPYYSQIELAMLKGARIDGIGFQNHMFFGRDNFLEKCGEMYNSERVFEVLDTYARFGKPMQITEITIPCYSDNPSDEEMQAEMLRMLYRIWFSHSTMKAIVYWNLPDGYAYNAEPGDMANGENHFWGGLVRFDMTPKPAYNVIKDLFGREWRTNIERTTGGEFEFRGFYGEYDLEATSNGRTVKTHFHLAAGGEGTLNVSL